MACLIIAASAVHVQWLGHLHSCCLVLVNHLSHDILCPVECSVQDYIRPQMRPKSPHTVNVCPPHPTTSVPIVCLTTLHWWSTARQCVVYSPSSPPQTLLLCVVCMVCNAREMEENHCEEPRSPCQHHLKSPPRIKEKK